MNLTEPLAGIYRIDLSDDKVIAGFSGRNYGNSRRDEFLSELGLNPRGLVMVKQVHGSEVAVVEKADPELLEVPADGLITKVPGLVLGIRTADCVPVFFWDPMGKAAGIAHGGWRGVKDGIMGRMLDVFEREFGARASDLRVAFGPSIRKCCYEVGKEFLGYFPGFYQGKGPDKGRLDLVGVVKNQLMKRGVSKDRVRDAGVCTVCENKKFFSYRVENQTQERILNVISLVG
jgi:polyphenol oxidase